MSLRVSVEAPESASLGDRPPIKVTLTNEGAAPTRVNARMAPGYRDMPVRELFAELARADSGAPAEIEEKDYDRSASPPSDYRDLAPGESISREVELFDYYAPTAPGRYRLTVFYNADGPLSDAPEDVAGGVFASEPVEIEVSA